MQSLGTLPAMNNDIRIPCAKVAVLQMGKGFLNDKFAIMGMQIVYRHFTYGGLILLIPTTDFTYFFPKSLGFDDAVFISGTLKKTITHEKEDQNSIPFILDSWQILGNQTGFLEIDIKSDMKTIPCERCHMTLVYLSGDGPPMKCNYCGKNPSLLFAGAE